MAEEWFDNFYFERSRQPGLQKSFSTFEMLTDLEIRRGTYRGRHPVWYVYKAPRVLGDAPGVTGSA